MTDLEGNELEVGAIYLFPSDNSHIGVGEYSHETAASYIFKAIRVENNTGVSAYLPSWKRQIPKDNRYNCIHAIKASDALIKRFIES